MSVTTKIYGKETMGNFIKTPSPEDLDFSTVKVIGTPTSTAAAAEITISGTKISFEITGIFSDAARGQLKTLADFSRLDVLISSTKIFIDNALTQEQTFSPAQKASVVVDDTSLAKLNSLFSGNDIFIGSETAGQTDNDSINGYGGDDIFYGNGNGQYDDIFHGGSGKDTSVYRGKLTNYAIKASDVWDPVAQKPT